jgi:hypothetical protein
MEKMMATTQYPSNEYPSKKVDLEEYIANKTGVAQQIQNRRISEAEKTEDMYAPLKRVLMTAYNHAAVGKGRERHGNGGDFTSQDIMAIARVHGIGFQTGQAEKKVRESHGMMAREDFRSARSELLGAINYLAAAYLLIEEKERDLKLDDGSRNV